jgi:hypothetical protein
MRQERGIGERGIVEGYIVERRFYGIILCLA